VGTHGGEVESPVLQSGFGSGVRQRKSFELGQQQQYNSSKSERASESFHERPLKEATNEGPGLKGTP
jgi:hypothetical protein